MRPLLRCFPRNFHRRYVLGLVPAMVALSTGLTTAHAAEPWPTKPVRIIVPFTAGGTTDVLARILGQRFSEMWKQSVVIENKLGAGGAIGAEATAKSPADGYTLLMASGSMFTVNPHLYPTLPYAMKDFSFITNVASGPMLVLVPPTLPVKNLADLIAMAKAQPNALNFGSAGNGSQVHMAAEAFADAAGIAITHVPYKGESLAYNDLIGGQLQLAVGNIGASAAFVKSGKLRALAVTGKERASLVPDVPTAEEAGMPGFENMGWFALVAPAGTPPDVIAKVQRDTVKVLAEPAIQERLTSQGMKAIGNSPEQLVKDIGVESAKWAQVVKRRNLVAK